MQRKTSIVFALITAIGLSTAGSDCFAQGGTALDADRVSVPQLLKNLESNNSRVAASAARTLGVVFSPGGRSGEEKEQSVTALIAHLDSKVGADIRRECARALGNIEAKSATEKMKVAMDDVDIEVAMAAGEAIGKILPVDEARTYLTEQGTDATEHKLIAALSGIAPISKAADIPLLKTGVATNNWRAHQAALRGLEQAVRAGGDLSAEDYDAVANVLGDDVMNSVNQAIHFFTHVRNDESFAAVLRATEVTGDGSKKDTSWRNRAYALRTLWHLGHHSQKQALPYIIRQLGDRTANVTNEAKRILVELRKEHHVHQSDLFPLLLTELEKAESLKLRAGIMREMGSHVDRQYASRVAKVASETLDRSIAEKGDWPSRSFAIRLLGESGYTGSLEPIATSVSDNVANVRQAAGRALEQLAPLANAEHKAAVPGILRPLLTNPVDWRKTAVAAKAFGPYAEAADAKHLSLLLSHSVINVRDGASQSLVTMSGSANSVLKDAVEANVTKELKSNPRAWQFGAPVLGALQNPAAIGQLTIIVNKGDWHSQVAAANAVTEIASHNKINDKSLSDALIMAGQSDVLQVQDACDRALRTLTK